MQTSHPPTLGPPKSLLITALTQFRILPSGSDQMWISILCSRFLILAHWVQFFICTCNTTEESSWPQEGPASCMYNHGVQRSLLTLHWLLSLSPSWECFYIYSTFKNFVSFPKIFLGSSPLYKSHTHKSLQNKLFLSLMLWDLWGILFITLKCCLCGWMLHWDNTLDHSAGLEKDFIVHAVSF